MAATSVPQTVLVLADPNLTPTQDRARAADFVKERGFKIGKAEQVGNYWRFRQHDPSLFRPGTFRTANITPTFKIVYGEPKRGSGITPRPNPTPRAWSQLGPDMPYEGKTPHAGLVVPGRKAGGARVATVATPPRPAYSKTQDGYRLGTLPNQVRARKGQIMLRAPDGTPRFVSRAYVSRKFREKALGADAFVRGEDRADIEARIAQLEEDPDHVPMPIGHEFRYKRGTNICTPDHPLWQSREWEEILEAAADRATRRAEAMGIDLAADATEFRPNPYYGAIRPNRGPMPSVTYEQLLAQEVRRDPRSAKYQLAEEKCIAWFRARNTRKAKAAMSTQREVALARQRAIRQGIDVTSAEYRDTLEGASKRGRRKGGVRKTGRARKAR